MSNGQPDQNKGLIPFMRPDVVVSPDEYAANLNKIAKIRQLAATMEQTNQQAHQRYIQQELQRRVEEGERAQLVHLGIWSLGDFLNLHLTSQADAREHER